MAELYALGFGFLRVVLTSATLFVRLCSTRNTFEICCWSFWKKSLFTLWKLIHKNVLGSILFCSIRIASFFSQAWFPRQAARWSYYQGISYQEIIKKPQLGTFLLRCRDPIWIISDRWTTSTCPSERAIVTSPRWRATSWRADHSRTGRALIPQRAYTARTAQTTLR